MGYSEIDKVLGKIKKLRIVFADDTKIQKALAGLFERLGLVTKTFNPHYIIHLNKCVRINTIYSNLCACI